MRSFQRALIRFTLREKADEAVPASSSPVTAAGAAPGTSAAAPQGSSSTPLALTPLLPKETTNDKHANPKHGNTPGAQLAGYMPLRGDFDVEHDNDAELLLADMEFTVS